MPPSLPAPTHPLDAVDRPIIERLLQVEHPEDEDFVNAARLWTRYRDSRLSLDLVDTLLSAMSHWGLTPDEVAERARAAWSRPGWRPSAFGEESSDTVGSGADVQS